MPEPDSYLRFPDVKARSGLSRTTIHRLVKAGDFPALSALAPAPLRGCHPTSPAGAKAVPMLASTGQHNHPRKRRTPARGNPPGLNR